jgi:hypothetical protein
MKKTNAIHGKTIARAAKLGIKLALEENGTVTAKAGKFTTNQATAKEAIVEIEALRANDPDRAAGMRALALAKPNYKAKGDVNNCGDWLAKLLKDHFLEDEGKKKAVFQMDDFRACLKANGIALEGRWVENQNPGWQGRFRMNGRQKLERVVAEMSGVTIEGEFHRAPNSFIGEMKARHPEVEVDEAAAA